MPKNEDDDGLWRPCGNWADFQSQIEARPELRGRPVAITIGTVCRLYGATWRTVLRAIRRREVDALVKRRVVRVTVESARARFGPPKPAARREVR